MIKVKFKSTNQIPMIIYRGRKIMTRCFNTQVYVLLDIETLLDQIAIKKMCCNGSFLVFETEFRTK